MSLISHLTNRSDQYWIFVLIHVLQSQNIFSRQTKINKLLLNMSVLELWAKASCKKNICLVIYGSTLFSVLSHVDLTLSSLSWPSSTLSPLTRCLFFFFFFFCLFCLWTICVSLMWTAFSSLNQIPSKTCFCLLWKACGQKIWVKPESRLTLKSVPFSSSDLHTSKISFHLLWLF